MAATPNPAIKRMEKLLECCFCTKTVTNPRTLSCYHSFCQHCLERFVAARREDAVKAGTEIPEIFDCPMCRTTFHVKKDESVENIPLNYFINNMLELFTLQQQVQCIKCQLCIAKDPATSRCVSCENYLCRKCLQAHNNWPAFGDHVVLTMQELAKPENRAKAREKPRCEKHDKILKFYCETCEALVCRYCVDINHVRPNHSWFPFSDIVGSKKEVLKKLAAVFEIQINEAVESNLKIQHAMETLKDNTAKAKDAIMQQQQEILSEFTKKLEVQTAVLLDQANMKYDEANKPLMKQQADVKDYLEKTKSSLRFAQNIISNGTDEDILSLKQEVKEKAEAIEIQRPRLMNPVHNGAFQYQGKSSKIVLENAKLDELGIFVYPMVQSLLQRSTILDGNSGHAKQLVDWVEDETFGWKLCYTASVDGWNGKDFHRKCDDVGPTVTLIKCGTNVFGGYNDRRWKHKSGFFPEYKSSEKSFLFSLRNKDNLEPFNCPTYADHRNKKAICCECSSGAIFGEGYDLSISSNASTNNNSYSNLGITYRPPDGYGPGTPQTKALLAGSYYFTPNEIEVFCR